MNISNWQKSSILDVETSEEKQENLANLTSNIGFDCLYYVNNGQGYNSPITVKALIFADNGENKNNALLVNDSMLIDILTNDFFVNNIKPNKNDKISLNGSDFFITNIQYIDKDNMLKTLIEYSYFVRLSIKDKRNLTISDKIR